MAVRLRRASEKPSESRRDHQSEQPSVSSVSRSSQSITKHRIASSEIGYKHTLLSLAPAAAAATVSRAAIVPLHNRYVLQPFYVGLTISLVAGHHVNLPPRTSVFGDTAPRWSPAAVTFQLTCSTPLGWHHVAAPGRQSPIRTGRSLPPTHRVKPSPMRWSSHRVSGVRAMPNATRYQHFLLSLTTAARKYRE
jgi:hypothetical protein